MIEVRDLRKEYGAFVAVEGATFQVDTGEVFGIVGPNGAGKTTTLKLLAGLIEPTDGSAQIDDYDAQNPEMHHILGFLPEESPLYEEMTALSYLRFFADLYDVPREVARDRITESLDRLELVHRDRKIGDMSKGMKRKVAIARSLVNDPDVLIYDEPASGLDPLTTNYIIGFIRDLAAAGKTIVFSAHNLHHVEAVCDRIAIMTDGRIVARGTMATLREEFGHTEYHVFTDVPVAGSVAQEGVHRTVVDTMAEVEEIRAAVHRKDGDVVDIRTNQPSLERLFLEIASDDPERAWARQATRERAVTGTDLPEADR